MNAKKWLAGLVVIANLFASFSMPAFQTSARAAEPDLPTAVRSFLPLILKPIVNAGKFTFASKRTGQWEIYKMNADGSSQVRLTSSDTVSDCFAPRWSPDGTKIVYYSNNNLDDYDIFVMNGDGTNKKNLTSHAGDDAFPAWSPDGREIVFASNRGGDWDIYKMDSNGNNLDQLTSNAADDTYPVFSPDGIFIAFISNRTGSGDIYRMDANGNYETRLTYDDLEHSDPNWSHDGTKIIYQAYQTNGRNWDIYVMGYRGENPTNLTPGTSSNETNPVYSPDGTRIAFTSDRDNSSGQFVAQIFTMSPTGTAILQVTHNPKSDADPDWHS